MHDQIDALSPDAFPPLVREIDDPPQRLYVRGTLPPADARMLCIVGSRKHTDYGAAVCTHLISGLSGHPIVIVSGLALGIDAIAHRAALNAGLTTLAVPGSGLDDRVLYPATHRSLARTICDRGGCLLSEYEPSFSATPWSFPKRNRIMAGLSHAVVVIEATEKSGTLITARLATEYNRDVLAVPGSVFSSATHGPHNLIKDGAIPVTSSDDILEALDLTPTHHTARTYDDCSPDELRVLELLTEPRTREELMHACTMDIHDINTTLSLLEIKGHITETNGAIVRR